MLPPILIQLCHRVSADAFACSGSEGEFLTKVRADPRFADLNGDSQTALIERSTKLRAHWLVNGVKEPIKQNFLDDLSDPLVLFSEVDSMAGYDFQARIPVDHVVALVKNFRSGDYSIAGNGKLVASALGEVSALIESGFMVTLELGELPSTMDGCLLALEGLTVEDHPQATALDPSLWVPIVLKLIELWLARRGS